MEFSIRIRVGNTDMFRVASAYTIQNKMDAHIGTKTTTQQLLCYLLPTLARTIQPVSSN